MAAEDDPPAEVLEIFSQITEDFRRVVLASERWRESGCTMFAGDLDPYVLGGWEGSFSGRGERSHLRIPVLIQPTLEDEHRFVLFIGHTNASRIVLVNGRIAPEDPILYQKTVGVMASIMVSSVSRGRGV